MEEYYIVRRDRADTDRDGYYRKMEIVSGPMEVSREEAFDEARQMQADGVEHLKWLRERGMFNGLIGNVVYFPMTADEIEEGRHRGIRIDWAQL